jgi:hypothetical protein
MAEATMWQPSRIQPPQGDIRGMVVDSGATSHFVRPAENFTKTGTSNKVVTLPNGEKIKASHTVHLPFDMLSDAARQAHVLPNLRTNLLVSVPKLADAGYTTIFHPHGEGVTVHKSENILIQSHNSPVLQGWRDDTGLWRFCSKEQHESGSAKPTSSESTANVYSLPSIKKAVRYLHAAAGFPTKDSWLKVINEGNYRTWPGLTTHTVRRHFPDNAIEVHKGHIKKQRQNVRSTKQTMLPNGDDTVQHSLSKHHLLLKVVHAHNTVYTD